MADYDKAAVDDAMDDTRNHYDDPTVSEVIDEIDVHHLISRCEGRSGGLRTSKPTTDSDGSLEAYVWRMSRFHSGDDPCMPVMAEGDLREWVNNVTGVPKYSSDRTDAQDETYDSIKEMMDEIVVTLILLSLGKNPKGGAERWKGLVY